MANHALVPIQDQEDQEDEEDQDQYQNCHLRTLNGRNVEVVEAISRWHVDICGVPLGPLEPNQVHTLTARTANSSSSVHKWAYYWQRTGQTKSIASLTGSFFSNWSMARQFSPSSQYTHPMWADQKLKRNVTMTSCNTLLPRSQPLRYLSLVTGIIMLMLLLVCSVMPKLDTASVPVTWKVRQSWNLP